MKIGLTSDIHLEFGDWYPVNPEGGDVLILSGDIMVASDFYGTHRTERFQNFLANCKKEWSEVVYVMGNHEHYNGDFAESSGLLREACQPLGIHFLDKECVTIKGVTFIGGTLWTDMNGGDEMTIRSIASTMNDFNVIRNSNRVATFRLFDEKNNVKFAERKAKFSPSDAIQDHEKFLGYIRTMIEGKFDQKFVVVGHHAPSRKSTALRYEHEELMNGGYSSDLEHFIVDHPQIKLWTHGHTHELFDYVVGETRIVCNPRGYIGYERGSEAVDPYRAKIIELAE